MIPFEIFFPVYDNLPVHLKKKAGLAVGFPEPYYFSRRKFLTPLEFEALEKFVKENTTNKNKIVGFVEDKEQQIFAYQRICELINSKEFQTYKVEMKDQVIDEQKRMFKILN